MLRGTDLSAVSNARCPEAEREHQNLVEVAGVEPASAELLAFAQATVFVFIHLPPK